MNQFLSTRETLKRRNMNILEFTQIPSNEMPIIKWWEILLMFFMLSLSGGPYIFQKFTIFIIISAIVPIVHVVRNYKRSVSYHTVFIFVFFLGYEVMHAFMFNLDYRLTFFKLALVLLFSATTVAILKNKFIAVLTKTMVLISLISFVFVFISYTPLHSILYNIGLKLFPTDEYNSIQLSTIIIFTFCWEYFEGLLPYVRNCGIFWEGGAFAVFLNITIFLNYSTKSIKSIRDLFDKDSIILILALISTTSTMGVVSLMIVLTFFTFQFKSAVKYLFLFLIIVSGYLAFTSVDFLGEKITTQLNQSKTSNNRFGAALMDFENIAQRPLLGWSRRIEVVFHTTVFSSKTHRPNGFTNFLRSYGLVYSTVYFFLVFLSFKNIYLYHHGSYNYYVPLFGIFLLCLVSFSEVIFDKSFLKSLIFLFTAYYPYPAKLEQPFIKKPFYTKFASGQM